MGLPTGIVKLIESIPALANALEKYFGYKIAHLPIEEEKFNEQKDLREIENNIKEERKTDNLIDLQRKHAKERAKEAERDAKAKFKREFGKHWRKAWDEMSEEDRNKYYDTTKGKNKTTDDNK